MSRTTVVAPTYTENFRCIGSACEVNCCRDWSVPIDRSAYEKCQTLPPSPLRTLIDASILLAPANATASDGFGPEGFAKILMNEANVCPMVSADGLCQIHAQVGPGYLSSMCATYPRVLRTLGGVEQNALAFSCPEAVRTVVLNPIDWKQVEPARLATGETNGGRLPAASAWAIRMAVVNVVTNRDYPLWQRLLLVGVLCQKLDALSSGWPEDEVSECLSEFNSAVAADILGPALEALPVDPSAHMDAVLRLAGLMLDKSNVTSRFVECINAFTSGIGNGPTATLETLTAGYKAAHDRYFAPFFARHPHMLENYLINTILRFQFPFGRHAMTSDAELSATREFTTLMAQFALMKGLLVGVAGFHRESFSADHLVHTLQAASKHFDHHPDFTTMAYELLVECRLDGLTGAAMLLRDQKSESRAIRTNSLSSLCHMPRAAISY